MTPLVIAESRAARLSQTGKSIGDYLFDEYVRVINEAVRLSNDNDCIGTEIGFLLDAIYFLIGKTISFTIKAVFRLDKTDFFNVEMDSLRDEINFSIVKTNFSYEEIDFFGYKS